MKKNRILKKILGASLLFAISISSNALIADVPGVTNKTFLMPRDVGTNLARKHTTWHKMRDSHCKGKDQFGARFEVTGFYQTSEKAQALGKYFGTQYNPSGANNLGKVIDYFGVDAADSNMPFFPQDIMHDALNGLSTGAGSGFQNTTVNPLSDKIQFRPRREMWGVDMTYYQNLDKWANGLFFRVTSPIAWTRSGVQAASIGKNTRQATNNTPAKQADNSTNYTPGTGVFPLQTATGSSSQISSGNIGAAGSDAVGSSVAGLVTASTIGNKVSVLDYLTGNVTQAVDPNRQVVLKASKVGTTSKTILADVRADLGYDFIAKEHMHVGLSAMVVAPTADTAKGEFLFEPLAGTGHWAVGGTLDGHYNYKFGECTHLGLHGAVNYQWVFEKPERRTLGFNYKDGTRAIYGGWHLGGQVNQGPLFPLANVLTRHVNVESQSKVDALAALSFSCNNWIFDLGYNFYFREEEKVSLKDAWTDNTYAIANFAYNTAAAVTSGGVTYTGFQPQGVVPGVGSAVSPASYAFNRFPSSVTPGLTTNYTINNADLVVDACATPAQMSHKIFGGVGYIFKHWNSPLSMSVGGSYEFADRRSTLEQWDVYAKIGISI